MATAWRKPVYGGLVKRNPPHVFQELRSLGKGFDGGIRFAIPHYAMAGS